MSKIKAIIIEDEVPARDLLKFFLKDFEKLEVVAECSDGFEGVKAIAKHQPDMIFLDIQMPRINGFEMLELLDKENVPLVIFTTAYDQFALKAFEHNAVDYILKPIGKDRLLKAIEKAIAMLEVGNKNQAGISRIIEKGFKTDKYLDRIILRSGEGIQVIHQEDLVCIEARNDYVIVSTLQNDYLKKKTLKYYEDNLDPQSFIRVHRSFIISLDSLVKIEPYTKDSYVAFLKNKRKVSVSKAGYSALMQRLNE
jgi:two-component system LytT family response regulator